MSVEPSGISLSERNERGDLRRRWAVEDESVEEAVNDISHRAGHNEREADQESPFYSIADAAGYVPRYSSGKQDSAQGKEYLVEQFHTEGHPVVFREQDIEPVGYMYRLVETHVRLHPNLNRLINNDNSEKDGYYGQSLCAAARNM